MPKKQVRDFHDKAKETMTPQEREEYINSWLTRLIKHAYAHSTAIKDKFDKAGVGPSAIRTVEDLQKIPITKKDNLLKMQRESPPFGGFLAIPLDKIKRIYISPGPIYDPVEAMGRYSGSPSPFVSKDTKSDLWSRRCVQI